ncbi:hypothetical protein [Embleya scabrispora]|uniref:hypothetical protein n=1 Tax=Embleya scabrispora TaxID=159449 RepID=UPI0003A1274B|nr:hypothetical protein [Embleya scabrispora]MYS80289.1 hypothetical protein [Streptomyces sp. SID5474]
MLDNEDQSRRERGDHDGAELAGSVRRAGWDQIPDWPRDAAGFATWPAPGQTSALVLNAARWALVVSGLDRWADIDDSLGIPEHAAMANEKRNISALIRARLTEQGWACPG